MTRRDRAVVIGLLAVLVALFVAIAVVSVLGSWLPQPVRIVAIFLSQLAALALMIVVIRRRENKVR